MRPLRQSSFDAAQDRSGRAGYKQTVVGVIPEEWDADRLHRFWSVTDCKHVTAVFIQNGIPVASIKEVQSRFVELSNAKRTTRRFYELLIEGGRKPETGDLILSRNATVGEIAQVAEWHPIFAMGQDVCLLRRKSPELSADYIQAVFQSPIIANQFSNLMVGSTFKRANVEQIRDLSVPMPPSPEQRAIAEALSDVDGLLGALDRLIAKKRDLKQAAMQQLLSARERVSTVTKFGELAAPRKERVDPRRSSTRDFCIELECIESGTGRLIRSLAATQESSLKSVFREGDVLFGKLRAYLRKYWLATRSGVCSTEIWVLAPNTQKIVAAYLLQLVQTERFIDAASTAYGTHMPRSDWRVVKDFDVHLPSVERQTAIASVLSDMDAELAALEQRREKTRALKQGMMQQLLTGIIRLV